MVVSPDGPPGARKRGGKRDRGLVVDGRAGGRAHARFLGRSAELPQALRQVRDRETGQTLNALRGRLEQAVGPGAPSLEREEFLDGLLTADVLDVTLLEMRRRGGTSI